MEIDKDKYLKRFETVKPKGAKNEISDLRGQTADLLGKPFGQVAKLTKGWSASKLYQRLEACKGFVNPPALWWKLYKEDKE